jgi:osmotically-inducible protein OsmY
MLAQEISNNMARTQLRLNAALALLIFAATLSAAPAAAPRATDLTKTFRDAGVTLEKLQVVEIGGIVVLRGRADEKVDAEAVGLLALQLGYTRVANLIQVFEAPDDALIERKAERELTIHRSLDGCKFSVDSRRGVLHVNGQVVHELQKDVAMQLLRTIDGVRDVKFELVKF